MKIVLKQFSHNQDTSSIWPIDGTLKITTTPGQDGSRNNGNKGVLQMPQRSRTGSYSQKQSSVITRPLIEVVVVLGS